MNNNVAPPAGNSATAKPAKQGEASSVTIIEELFRYGLGEHLVLHIQQDKSILGKIVYDKGKMLLKDHGLLSDFKPEFLKPCWEKGLIGMLCSPHNKEWESLSFYGLEKCALPVDLESTRHGFLTAAQNQYGEKLIDFVGSIYRGFRLMLDNHFLPVILLQRVSSKSGETGLAVTDLRTAPMPINLIQQIHGIVREEVDMRLTLNVVEDTSLGASDFEAIFKQYLK
jgi:hypothetical protein